MYRRTQGTSRRWYEQHSQEDQWRRPAWPHVSPHGMTRQGGMHTKKRRKICSPQTTHIFHLLKIVVSSCHRKLNQYWSSHGLLPNSCHLQYFLVDLQKLTLALFFFKSQVGKSYLDERVFFGGEGILKCNN